MTEDEGEATSIADLWIMGGAHFVCTPWQTLSHEQIAPFAGAVGGDPVVRLDPNRSEPMLVGGTIADGLVGLLLLAPICRQLLPVRGAESQISYGFDRVRIPAPLPVGGEWRGRAEIVAVENTDAGARISLLVRLEVRGSDKPTVVAECLICVDG
jgi:acyl dehydratase